MTEAGITSYRTANLRYKLPTIPPDIRIALFDDVIHVDPEYPFHSKSIYPYPTQNLTGYLSNLDIVISRFSDYEYPDDVAPFLYVGLTEKEIILVYDTDIYNEDSGKAKELEEAITRITEKLSYSFKIDIS